MIFTRRRKLASEKAASCQPRAFSGNWSHHPDGMILFGRGAYRSRVLELLISTSTCSSFSCLYSAISTAISTTVTKSFCSSSPTTGLRVRCDLFILIRADVSNRELVRQGFDLIERERHGPGAPLTLFECVRACESLVATRDQIHYPCLELPC